MSARELVEYLVARAAATASGCWEWQGHRDCLGYGRYSWRRARAAGVSYFAHRALYELSVGRIPEDLQLDHLCRNPSCVNPAHLEPVTNRENQMRSPVAFTASNARKMHCPAGHLYDEANTLLVITPGQRRRCCRICNRAAAARYRARKAAS